MPRKKFYPTNCYPYHVTARSHNRERFYAPLEDMWSLFAEQITKCTEEYEIQVNSFVMMSNHFHMLITTPNANLDKAMNRLMRDVSKNANKSSGRINQTFGGPYHWSLITNPKYYFHAYKYVYRNPVQAGLSTTVQSYPYSTMQFLIGKKKSDFSFFDNMHFIHNPFHTLKWLNDPFPNPENWEEVRLALRKREFSYSRDKDSREPSSLENYNF